MRNHSPARRATVKNRGDGAVRRHELNHPPGLTRKDPKKARISSGWGGGKAAGDLPGTLVLVYLLVLLALGADLGSARAEEYLWPLPGTSPSLTGTFMEFREGRYHSGIDLRTQGREGLRVVAPAAGSIVRIRSSATGYGVAIYLLLPGGEEIVLAHLSVLADRIREPLVRAWRESGRYHQDLSLPAGRLPVQRGELLALSGSTGVGAPHLHLELRDARERPVNPLLHGFSVPDSLAPQVVALRLIPLSRGAWVEGVPLPCSFAPGATAAAAGSLGLMVEIDDRSDGGQFRLAPLGISVEREGEEIYRLENLVFDFSQTGQMRLEKAPDPDSPRHNWLRLYRRPGNRLPGRQEENPQGITFVAMAGRSTELVVKAWDAAGNRSRASLRIDGGAPKEGGPPVRYAGESPFWPLAAAGKVLAEGSPRPLETRVGGRGWEIEFRDPEGEALYPGGSLWWEPSQELPKLPSGARLVAAGGRIRAAGAVFKTAIEVAMLLPLPENGKWGLFEAGSTGKWRFLGGRDRDGEWEGEMGKVGNLALLEDPGPPRMGPFTAGGRPLHSGEILRARSPLEFAGGELHMSRWPALQLPLSDPVAGIEEDGIDARIDGTLFPARYDPEKKELVFEFWLDPGEGEHLFSVEAR